jgi:hypothetical protein
MTRVAACSCGRLEVACDGEPHRVSMCHCLACQRRTGSAFGVQARFRGDQVTVRGESRVFVRVGDDGGRISFHFCPECGATVFWRASFMEGAVAVAVGAFADPGFPAPTVSVYESRRHAWTDDPDRDVERIR